MAVSMEKSTSLDASPCANKAAGSRRQTPEVSSRPCSKAAWATGNARCHTLSSPGCGWSCSSTSWWRRARGAGGAANTERLSPPAHHEHDGEDKDWAHGLRVAVPVQLARPAVGAGRQRTRRPCLPCAHGRAQIFTQSGVSAQLHERAPDRLI